MRKKASTNAERGMVMRKIKYVLCLVLSLLICSCAVPNADDALNPKYEAGKNKSETITLDNIPEYDGVPYVELNDNEPNFSEKEITTDEFETYQPLDRYGRCQTAYANISPYTMPTEERGAIGMVKPSGWHTVKYDFVDGKYLYNRCHLIGFQLAGENANERNLITGTRYMNVDGMLPFEDEVADYVKDTANHVLYRVTPIYEGDNLVADGVEMEAYSVEDQGEGVSFHVFVYNVQPGVSISYDTGESRLADQVSSTEDATGKNADENNETETYVLNKNTMKFHRKNCSSVGDMSKHNRVVYEGTRSEVIDMGYESCKNCNP